MISREIIPYLKLIHASFNTTVLLFFIYQGLSGLKIRKKRKVGAPDFNIIKRHRKLGPVLAVMGGAGFFAGLTITYIDIGRLLIYMPHLINGIVIISLITATFLISRNIRASEPQWRTAHLIIGILIVSLYFIQVFLGLGILL